MKRLFVLTVGLALCVLFAYAESDTLKNKKQILRVVSKLEKQESLLLNYEITKKNRRLANKLSKLSSNEDLVSLTENNNPTVFVFHT